MKKGREYTDAQLCVMRCVKVCYFVKLGSYSLLELSGVVDDIADRVFNFFVVTVTGKIFQILTGVGTAQQEMV